jgi:hypothetical protein
MNSLDELPSLGDFIPGADVVELLEQGLRVDPDDEPVAAASDDGAPLDGPLVAVDLGDQPVIDLDAGDD